MDCLFSTGYESVKSFAIATSKVNDDILTYWLNQNSKYPVGAMKAAYGTFLTALLMEYIHDKLADAAATEFNVTWARTDPIIVSVGDDPYQTYLTLECDHSMGMTVIGSLKNMILFNSACSSQISIIEYGIMQNLDFIYQYSTVSMDVMGSVTRDMFYVFWTGTDLESFTQNGYVVMKLVGRDDLVLLYDPETGIMRDINTANGFYGAYCFHDQITELAVDIGNFFLNHQATIWRDFFGALGLMGSYYGLYTSIPAVDAVITAGSGLTLSLGFSFFGASIGFGLLLVDMRTNYVPIEYWKHFSFHRTWIWGYELRNYIGSDNYIHYIEIPKNSDGTLNWNEAIYY